VTAGITGEADGQRTFLDAVGCAKAAPDVVADDPPALAIPDVFERLRLVRILEQPLERPTPAVVVFGMVQIDYALTFHIGLTGKDEDLQHGGFVFCDSPAAKKCQVKNRQSQRLNSQRHR
jgi:hypothetical protein